MAGVDAIDVDSDPRIKSEKATLNDKRYHYYIGLPNEEPKGTIFLIHGFPDLAIGWRYQIPTLLKLGFRVVVPDMMGYGQTECPDEIEFYTFKRAAEDMRELARQLGLKKIILGGHDWGGVAVYRIALHEPALVSHAFVVCTPYFPPSKTYVSLEDSVTMLPAFGYQVQFVSGEPEKRIGHDEIPQFVNAMFGGRTKAGEYGMNPMKGINFDAFPNLERSPLLPPKIHDHYVQEMRRNGIRGPMNWYRTRKANFDDETHLKDPILHQPILYIGATKDVILRPELSAPMDKLVPSLTRRNVEAGHWALWEKAADVNAALVEWFTTVVLSGKSTL
ncbi:MAG: hypothetical protein M1814_006700 [Vezdaea aestivalis]|nr:MAG: hypothetical protein M1814_006700 [Vezdaea aestivalis]